LASCAAPSTRSRAMSPLTRSDTCTPRRAP